MKDCVENLFLSLFIGETKCSACIKGRTETPSTACNNGSDRPVPEKEKYSKSSYSAVILQ